MKVYNQIDGWIERQIARQIGRQIGEQIARQIDMQMNGKDGWMDSMGGWIGWMDGRRDGMEWNGQTDGSLFPFRLKIPQDFFFGSSIPPADWED